MKNLFHKLFDKAFVSGIWNIGYAHQTIDDLMTSQQLADLTWLAEDNADYSADPFVFKFGGKNYVAYEHLNFLQGDGCNYIIELEQGFSTKREMSPIFDLPCHQSYPYVFQHHGNLYCVPETAGLSRVELYRCAGEPDEWSSLGTLLNNFAGVDSSIAKINDLFWIFTSPQEDQNQLQLFYAENLQGPYQPHLQRPAKQSTLSRMAGHLFEYQGQWYRPSQDLSDKYGGAIWINRIVELTPNSFLEQCAFRLTPRPPYDDGLHNISFGDGVIVVDGRRRSVSIWNPLKKWIRKLRQRRT